MSHVAKVLAQISGWSRVNGSTSGTIQVTVGYRLLQAPETSGVIPVTAGPLTDREAFIGDITDALTSLLSVEHRDIVLIGV